MTKKQITATIEGELLDWIDEKVIDRTFKSKSEAVELSVAILRHIDPNLIKPILIENECKLRQIFLFLDKEIVEEIYKEVEKGGFSTKEEFVLHLIEDYFKNK